MPRFPRIDIPGLVYHVTNRGIRRAPIFLADRDRQKFLRFLIQTQAELPFRLHAYCLMTNHYHLLLQTINHSLSKTMHYFGTLFSAWFNREYEHPGPVFQARFHSLVVKDDTYFMTAARYIHLNPVRAGIVQRPEDYPWSNYSRLIRAEPDALIEPQFLLDYFGMDGGQQRARYRAYVEDGMSREELVTDSVLRRMRSWGPLPALSKTNRLK